MPRHALLVSLLALSVTWSCGSDGGNGGPSGPGSNAFAPTSNTTLSGNQSFDSVTIPAGVTVTVTGNLVLISDGDVTIAGTLTGDCVAIAVTGAAALTVTGEVSNDCASLPAGDPPTLELTADGAVVFDGAVVTSSGDVTVKNDPTLSDADFPEAALAPAGATGGLVPAQSVRVFEIRNSSQFTHPGSARSGEEGDDDETGQRGRRGARFTFFSRGDLVVDSSAIDGQDGGAGGDHEKSADGNVTTEGGDGADGGDVRILATQQVILRNNTTVKSGDGGKGGDGTATSTGGDGARAGSATATGGDGGEAGLLRASGAAGIVIQSGATVEIGKGGDGGAGTATGADGSICVEGHGQHGGNASATGGDGADSPEGRLRLTGNVSGAPQLAGGDAGHGGNATANAGKGKDGENCDDCKDGGDGGNGTAEGGDGGDSLIRDAANQLFGDGGDGGGAAISAGNAGTGFSCCDPPEKGGNGGDGGDANGGDGEPGSGQNPGTARGVTITGHGNGANGGDGMPVGDGGDPGTDGTESDGPKNVTASFAPGVDGDPCPEPRDLRVDPRSAQASGNVVQQGTQTLDIKDETSGQTVGDIVAEFLGTVFVGLNPARFGLSPGSSVEVRPGEANLNGQPFPVDEGMEQVEVCGVNNPSTGTLTIERRDSGGSLLSQESIDFGNMCREILGANRISFNLDPSSNLAIDFIINILDQ